MKGIRFQIREGLTGARCKILIGNPETWGRYYKEKTGDRLEHPIPSIEGLFFHNNTLSSYIFLKKYEDDPKCNNLLQHEIHHLVKYIIKTCGLGSNEEVHSYMVGEITQLFKHKYKQVCKKKNPPQSKRKKR